MKYKILLPGLLFSLMISSCIYYPQSTDIPLINHKNDLRVDAGISAVPSAQATVSYGVTEKIAIQGFGSIGSDDHYYLQAATGIYKNRANNRVIELYGGFGYGYGSAYNGSMPGDLTGDYQLYFAQVNYGKIAHESSNVELGFGLKTGILQSNLTDKNYYEWTSQEGPFDVYHDNSFLFEPTGMVRFGGERLRLNIKIGGTVIHKFTNTDKHLPYYYANIGVGINFKL